VFPDVPQEREPAHVGDGSIRLPSRRSDARSPPLANLTPERHGCDERPSPGERTCAVRMERHLYPGLMSAPFGTSWSIVAHPSAVAEGPLRLPEAALAAAPPSLRTTEEFLPKKPKEGSCRLCGNAVPLTKEHVPQKAVTAMRRVRRHTLEEHLARLDIGDPLPGGEAVQGGTWGYTLCQTCNNKTGEWYGNEYKRWCGGALSALKEIAIELGVDTESPGSMNRFADILNERDQEFTYEARLDEADVGSFVRQVLTMMCTVTATWELTTQHPEIERIVLGQEPLPLPDALVLTTGLYVGPVIRLNGPTCVAVGEEWRWVAEIAYPPFVHYLVLAASGPVEPDGFNSGALTTNAPGVKVSDFPATMHLALGNNPYPGDYRTVATIRGTATQ
jgi:hypothetical protein